VDDALAILLALRSPDLKVEAITPIKPVAETATEIIRRIVRANPG
jgi:inosine-uridine nucleoside N-ribohydrolase